LPLYKKVYYFVNVFIYIKSYGDASNHIYPLHLMSQRHYLHRKLTV